jgi:predicted cobalt transporter CbtA
MIRILLVRGMAAGIVAGLLAFGMAKVFGEPQVDKAIAFESQMEEAKKAQEAQAAPSGSSMAGMPGMDASQGGEEEELVSRHVQSTIGLFTAVMVYGASFGGIFALVYAFALGRIGGVSPRGLAALLALAAFICIALVPILKYPANPPAIGNPETIGPRTGLYLSMLVISVGAMISAVLVGRGVLRNHGIWNATFAGAAVYVAIVAVAQLLMPDVNEVPEGFPAVVLWRFRVANLGIEAVLWGTLGLVFGYLTERSLQAGRAVLRPAE